MDLKLRMKMKKKIEDDKRSIVNCFPSESDALNYLNIKERCQLSIEKTIVANKRLEVARQKVAVPIDLLFNFGAKRLSREIGRAHV